jgi:hypothetical protein
MMKRKAGSASWRCSRAAAGTIPATFSTKRKKGNLSPPHKPPTQHNPIDYRQNTAIRRLFSESYPLPCRSFFTSAITITQRIGTKRPRSSSPAFDFAGGSEDDEPQTRFADIFGRESPAKGEAKGGGAGVNIFSVPAPQEFEKEEPVVCGDLFCTLLGSENFRHVGEVKAGDVVSLSRLTNDHVDVWKVLNSNGQEVGLLDDDSGYDLADVEETTGKSGVFKPRIHRAADIFQVAENQFMDCSNRYLKIKKS